MVREVVTWRVKSIDKYAKTYHQKTKRLFCVYIVLLEIEVNSCVYRECRIHRFYVEYGETYIATIRQEKIWNRLNKPLAQ